MKASLIRQQTMRVLKEIVENFPVGASDETDLERDLGFDSVKTMELVFGLENKFGVIISSMEAARLRFLKDIYGLLENKLSA